ncbi:MAG TPA: type II toxin-antitoxin system HicB family antitoxin [bacterium]|nr:type II toxin-antitoxin system HicB family antitoxin [bacterium]HOL96740.1 type II toxin-antitoxin system HicB family antitoxin [bacterium]HPP00267.1 type II toxin-antitoxin system HicB family antitoxin [bacterium]HXK96095.1 type II toxin-antitoxin system HicB family antitoxin [bacterium]
MRFQVLLREDETHGGFYARTLGDPGCFAVGKTREEALENIRGEIRYRVEYCPCAWVPDDYVQLDVLEE